MKKTLQYLLLFYCVLASVAHSAVEHAAVKKPLNFIIILLDDMGLRDAGFAGSEFIETPAMDRLAREGVVFSHAYANSPNCAPSRAAIMSGQYAPRTGIYTMGNGDAGHAHHRRVLAEKNSMYLPESVYTLAELLHDNGYITAHIGKWNLGTGAVRGPLGQGFDSNIGGSRLGSLSKGHVAPYDGDLPGLENAPVGEHMTHRLNNEAIDFVKSHAEDKFFLYLSHFAPHFPLQAPVEMVKKYKEKSMRLCELNKLSNYCGLHAEYIEYVAMINDVDNGIAHLQNALEEKGILDNTVIVLMSDNGGYRWQEELGALRGQKSQLYEGGIRVPMVWRVPHSQQGAKIDVPVMGVDIFPTFAALAGIDVSGRILDGVNLTPLFDKADRWQSRPLFWYLPGYTQDSVVDDVYTSAVSGDAGAKLPFTQLPAAVIQRDGWKLIRYYDGTPAELYNLQRDESEQHNLYSSEKKRATQLMQALESWLKSSGGTLTLPVNPEYTAPSGHSDGH